MNEILLACEEEFDMLVPDEDDKMFLGTIQEMVDYLDRRIAEKKT